MGPRFPCCVNLKFSRLRRPRKNKHVFGLTNTIYKGGIGLQVRRAKKAGARSTIYLTTINSYDRALNLIHLDAVLFVT